MQVLKPRKTVDRGGLVHISEDAFRFFLAVEYATRRNLRVPNAISMDENFHNKLTNLVVEDSDVQFHWCQTAVEDEDAGELVMKKLVEKWITVRGFSFTNSILEQYKQKIRKQLPNPRAYGLNCSQNNVYFNIILI